MVAHHYLAALELSRAAGGGIDGLVGPARRASREAGDRALTLNAFAAAKSLYATALELWPQDDPEHAVVLYRYGRALFDADEAGEDVLSQATERLLELGRVEEAAEAVVLLVELAWKRGDRDETFERLRRATALVEDRAPSRVKAGVLSTVSRFQMLAGEGEEAVRVGREALAMAEGLGLDDIRAHALINIGPARYFSGDTGGLDDVEAAIEIAAAINSPQVVRGYTNLAAMVAFGGDVRRSAQLEEEGLALARRFGHEPMSRFLEGNRAATAYFLGEWDTTLAGAAAFEGSHHYQESGLLRLRSLIRLARADEAGAEADARRALELARGAKDPQVIGPVLAMVAYVFFVLRHRRDAEQLEDELLEDPGLLAYTNAEMAWVLRTTGRADAARAALATLPYRTPWLDANRSVLDGDFAAAADVLDEIGALPAKAFCELRAAEELVADGRRAEADRYLHRALGFWRSVGATRYIREGEALLAATA